MRPTEGVARAPRRDTCTNAGIFLALGAAGEGLAPCKRCPLKSSDDEHTCKNGRLEELNQFVDLDKHVDSHLQLRTDDISFS